MQHHVNNFSVLFAPREGGGGVAGIGAAMPTQGASCSGLKVEAVALDDTYAQFRGVSSETGYHFHFRSCQKGVAC
jgi:hypothetical protein